MPAAPACAPRGCLCRRPPAPPPPPSRPRFARTMIAAAFLVLLRPYSIQCALFLLLLLLGTIATIVFFCCWHRKLQKGRHPMKSVFSGRSRSRGETRRSCSGLGQHLRPRLLSFLCWDPYPALGYLPKPSTLTCLAALTLFVLTSILQSADLGRAKAIVRTRRGERDSICPFC